MRTNSCREMHAGRTVNAIRSMFAVRGGRVVRVVRAVRAVRAVPAVRAVRAVRAVGAVCAACAVYAARTMCADRGGRAARERACNAYNARKCLQLCYDRGGRGWAFRDRAQACSYSNRVCYKGIS